MLVVSLNVNCILVILLLLQVNMVAHVNLPGVHLMHVSEKVAALLSRLIVLGTLLLQLICPLVGEHNVFSLGVRLLHVLHVYLGGAIERLDVALEGSHGRRLLLLVLLALQVLLIARVHSAQLIFLELCLVVPSALLQGHLVVKIRHLNLIQHVLQLDFLIRRGAVHETQH